MICWLCSWICPVICNKAAFSSLFFFSHWLRGIIIPGIIHNDYKGPVFGLVSAWEALYQCLFWLRAWCYFITIHLSWEYCKLDYYMWFVVTLHLCAVINFVFFAKNFFYYYLCIKCGVFKGSLNAGFMCIMIYLFFCLPQVSGYINYS